MCIFSKHLNVCVHSCKVTAVQKDYSGNTSEPLEQEVENTRDNWTEWSSLGLRTQFNVLEARL